MKLLAEVIGESPGIVAVRERVRLILRKQSDARRTPMILIEGETGTGKGLLARAIHRASQRASEAFVAINCAAIPDTLLEAELFGVERGAFTDARQAKAGLFQTAHRGTLFLDEVGLLPAALQAKLLQAIDERAVRRLGSTRSETIDAQIITATNEDLAAAMRAHRFREDLYHRLSVVTLWLPPLRERGRDILLLAEHYLASTCADYHLPPKSFTADAQQALLRYAWPGNVRELSNVIERVALLDEDLTVDAASLGLAEAPAAPTPRPPSAAVAAAALGDAVGAVVKERVLEALRATRWNISRAAALLSMPRNTLRYQIEKYRLRPDDAASPAAPSAPAAGDETTSAVVPVEAPVGLPERSALPVDTATGPSPAPAPPAAMPPEAMSRDASAPVLPRWERRHLALLRAAITPADPNLVADDGGGLQLLVEKVHSFGGRIEELGQWGIVAAFGLDPIEDAPTRAGLSALAMQKATQQSRPLDGDRVAMTIAIHSGQVMIGRVAGAVEIDQSAKRQAWSVLDGLVERALPDTIVVSQAAAPSLERRFDLVPLGPAEESPRVYRLTGRHGSGAHRRMARFVGRGTELQMLGGHLAAAMRGHGQVVGIVGEAGIGKSRLLFELRQSLARDGVWYVEGGCLSHGSAIPYLPVVDILRQSCGLADTDGAEAVTEKLHAMLQGFGVPPDERALYLLHLLGVRDPSGRLDELSPEAVKARTFETLRQVVFKASQVRPVILVVEDLHWIDRTSEECLASLVESMMGAPILFISTYRPGYRPPWIDKSYATQMALQPLAPDDSLSVVRSILAQDDVPDPLARLILAKAEGNPFFLEELARTLGEGGASPEGVAVPDTIQDVLLARVDRLAEEPRRLLQTASVLGREVSSRLLRALWEGPGPLDPHLHELTRLEFLYERTGAEESVAVFKHALIQEVAYESLLAPRRKALHAAAARALEVVYRDRLEEVYDRLAHHCARTDNAGKAVEYLTRFAAKAARGYAHVEAIASLQEALVHAERLAEEGRDRLVLDLVLRLVHSLNFRGRFKEALDLLRGHWPRLERLHDSTLTGGFWFWRSRLTSVLGDREEAAHSARMALEEAACGSDAAAIGKAYFALAYEDFWAGAIQDGIVHAASAVVYLEKTPERWWLAQAHWVAGIIHILVGDFERGLEATERMRAIGEAIGDPRLLSAAAWTTGGCHSLMGEWEAGLAACRRGLEISVHPGDTAVTLGFLGGALLEKGDFGEAIPVLEHSVQQCVRFGIRDTLGWFTTLLGEAYLLSGRIDDARERALEGLRITTETRYRLGIAWAHRVLGRIALAAGDSPGARTCFDEALRTQREIQARHEMGRTHLDLARLAHREGKRQDARAHLADALGLFVQLRVPRYIEQTHALAAELGVAPLTL